jgi:hypothetical protein
MDSFNCSTRKCTNKKRGRRKFSLIPKKVSSSTTILQNPLLNYPDYMRPDKRSMTSIDDNKPHVMAKILITDVNRYKINAGLRSSVVTKNVSVKEAKLYADDVGVNAIIKQQRKNTFIDKTIERQCKYIDAKGKVKKKDVYFINEYGFQLCGPISRYGYVQLSATKYLQPVHHHNNFNMNSLIAGKETRRGKDLKFICWIPSPERCKLMSRNEWESIVDVLDSTKKNIPNNNRGHTKKGISQHYMSFGWRKDRNTKYVSKYCLRQGTDDATRSIINTTINCLVNHCETVASVFFENMSACEDYKELQTNWQIPTITEDGYFTQCSIGYNYQSPMHVDNDYFYTVITCFCKTVTDPNEVIYDFCFPEYQTRIPMYNGTVFVFDPSCQHCATNPYYEDSYIMSCYVSSKTVQAHVSSVVYEELF